MRTPPTFQRISLIPEHIDAILKLCFHPVDDSQIDQLHENRAADDKKGISQKLFH
jgi:hypothetical protein